MFIQLSKFQRNLHNGTSKFLQNASVFPMPKSGGNGRLYYKNGILGNLTTSVISTSVRLCSFYYRYTYSSFERLFYIVQFVQFCLVLTVSKQVLSTIPSKTCLDGQNPISVINLIPTLIRHPLDSITLRG